MELELKDLSDTIIDILAGNELDKYNIIENAKKLWQTHGKISALKYYHAKIGGSLVINRDELMRLCKDLDK